MLVLRFKDLISQRLLFLKVIKFHQHCWSLCRWLRPPSLPKPDAAIGATHVIEAAAEVTCGKPREGPSMDRDM